MRSLRLLAVAALLACCSRADAPSSRPSPPAEIAAATAARTPAAPRPTSSDVTFLVVSDTHFGHEGIERTHEVLVSKMSSVTGVDFPRAVGGAVFPPRGLVITGDLTEWGRREQWDRFVAWYGPRGRLRLPVFETVGNHDKVEGPFVEAQVAQRHGGRFYAWDWDELHLVALGEAPDDEGLAFLERDLAVLEPDVPIALFFHLPLAGPFSRDRWFGEGTYRTRFAAVLASHNVVGIFHGHHHARGHYVWNGIDVYKPGAVKDDGHTFAVVHLTRARMTVAWRATDRDAWVDVHDKQLRPPR